MPRIIYERSDETATIERDEVQFRNACVFAYDNRDGETGIRNKKRIPMERVVEVDG